MLSLEQFTECVRAVIDNIGLTKEEVERARVGIVDNKEDLLECLGNEADCFELIEKLEEFVRVHKAEDSGFKDFAPGDRDLYNMTVEGLFDVYLNPHVREIRSFAD